MTGIFHSPPNSPHTTLFPTHILIQHRDNPLPPVIPSAGDERCPHVTGENFWIVTRSFSPLHRHRRCCLDSPETWLDLEGWSISWRRCQSSQSPRALMAALSSRFKFTSPRMRPGSTYKIHTSPWRHFKTTHDIRP